MNPNIKSLLAEIENNLELIYEYPFEEVKGVYQKVNTMLVMLSDENTERYSNGIRKEAAEESRLEQHLEDNGSSQPIG